MKKPAKQRRRAGGEGTVFQRSDGRWIASGKRDPRTGKRARYTGATQAEALAKRAAALKRLEASGGIRTKDPTVESYLRLWLDSVAKERVRTSTLTSYRSKVETCIIPTIGKLRLSDVLPSDVRAMMTAVVAGKGKGRKARRSPRTANYCRSILAKALDDARRDRIISGDNAATLADVLPHKRPETSVLGAEEVGKLGQALEGEPLLRPALLLAITTGLRLGEVLGLRWVDVVFAAGAAAGATLHLRLQLQRVDKVQRLVELKTDRSKRSIDVEVNLASLLRAQKVWQARRQLELGQLWDNALGLVFTNDAGRPLDDGRVRRGLQRSLKAAGVTRVRFHDLRHSAASLMLERNGGDLKAVSDTLGHSTIAITADTYAHVHKRVLARTVGALDDLIPATTTK